MTLSGAKARYQLNTGATPTGTNVTGPNTIGVSLTTSDFADADVAYSFKVTANGGGDSATLTYSNGAVAQTSGAPVIVDGDGNDFEGVAISMASIYGLFVEVGGGGGGSAVLTNTDTTLPDVELADGSSCLTIDPSGRTIAGDTMVIAPSASGDVVTVTVIGKST